MWEDFTGMYKAMAYEGKVEEGTTNRNWGGKQNGRQPYGKKSTIPAYSS